MSQAPVWRISGGRRLTPAPFLVAGIINLTPDSFSGSGGPVCGAAPEGKGGPGGGSSGFGGPAANGASVDGSGSACGAATDGSGAFFTKRQKPAPTKETAAPFSPNLKAVLDLARLHLEQGAHILDLGAESTRPGARGIGHDEEWRRLEPALQALLAMRAALPRLPAPEAPAFCISIDTFRAETARKALEAAPAPQSPALAGHKMSAQSATDCVDIINDISGGAFDPGLYELLAWRRPGYVLCHCPARPAVMQRAPRYADLLSEVESFFVARLSALVKAGLPEECVALDPGIGFGKNTEHNLALLRALPRFAALGRPIYLGLSRKSFLGEVSGLPLESRGPATAAALALTARMGASIQRVHDVGAAMAALSLVRALEERPRK